MINITDKIKQQKIDRVLQKNVKWNTSYKRPPPLL